MKQSIAAQQTPIEFAPSNEIGSLDAVLCQCERFSLEQAVQLIHSLCGCLQQQSTPLGWLSPKTLTLHADYTVTLCPPQQQQAKQADITMFTAPECYDAAPPTLQSDIYAVGVLFNLLLTGLSPAEHPAQGNAWGIIQRCTQPNPSDRFSSVQELSNALGRLTHTTLSKQKQAKQAKRTPRDEQKAEQKTADQTQAEKAKGRKKQFSPRKVAFLHNIIGFRSGKPWKSIIAVFGYWLIFRTGLTLEVSDAGILLTYLNRFLFCATCLEVVLFTFNCNGIQEKVPFCHSANVFVRMAAVLITDVLIVLLNLCVLIVLIEPLFA